MPNFITREVRYNEIKEYNGDGVFSGHYIDGPYYVEVARNSKGDARKGGRYNKYRLSTPWIRDVWSMSESPISYDSRGSDPHDPKRGAERISWPSTRGFHFNHGPSQGTLARIDNAASAAQTKALTDGKNRLQLGSDIGEARQTFGMIADAASTLANAYLSARRGNFAQAAKHLGLTPRDLLSGGTLSKRWLELQYGWKPLMGTIYDGIAQMDPQGPELNGLVLLKGAYGGSWTDEVRSGDANWVGTQTGKFGVRTVYACKVLTPTGYALARNGLINPLSVAWELMPFSFVVDWFVPVGSVIDAMTSTLGLEYVDGYSSYFREFTNVWRHPSGARLTEHNKRVQRFVKGGMGVAEWYADEDPLRLGNKRNEGNPFNSPRVDNALALIRQVIFHH